MILSVSNSHLPLGVLFAFTVFAPVSVHAEVQILESDVLTVRISQNGVLAVRDRRTGREWTGATFDGSGSVELGKVEWSIHGAELECCLSLRKIPKEGVVFPAPFCSAKGEALIVPLGGEGFRLPIGGKCPVSKDARIWDCAMWSSRMSMPFFGVVDKDDETGWMIIVDTPEDAAMRVARDERGLIAMATVAWFPECGASGYSRKFRIMFFDRGGYVAMAKRYRQYAKAKGLVKTFREKMKDRPMVERLPGAANVWYFPTKGDPPHAKVAAELREAGLSRFLWSSAAPLKDVRRIAAMPNVLIGRYDVCRDVYYPALLDALGWKNPPKSEICRNTSAWPDDIMWDSPSSNSWRRAWAITCKDGRKRNCAAQCDIPAIARLERNVANELKDMPFTARFMDVVVAKGWEECYNPSHPMTRRVSRKAKTELLEMLGRRFSLVVGSEQGMDAVVPVCDYFEGMMSPPFGRMPHGRSGYGRKEIFREGLKMSDRISAEELGKVELYGLNEKLRIPLFELVYHDCVCSHWYWYDYSNRPLHLWRKRDMFNVLYGTAPMYIFDYRHWREYNERFVESWRLVEKVARDTGFSEMVSHRTLNAERTVQETHFADGTTVVVDFRNGSIRCSH